MIKECRSVGSYFQKGVDGKWYILATVPVGHFKSACLIRGLSYGLNPESSDSFQLGFKEKTGCDVQEFYLVDKVESRKSKSVTRISYVYLVSKVDLDDFTIDRELKRELSDGSRVFTSWWRIPNFLEHMVPGYRPAFKVLISEMARINPDFAEDNHHIIGKL